jgi:hypothetical protein
VVLCIWMSGKRRTREGVQGRRTGEEELRRLYRKVETVDERAAAGMTDRVASCGSLYDSTNLLLQYCNNGNVIPSAEKDQAHCLTVVFHHV